MTYSGTAFIRMEFEWNLDLQNKSQLLACSAYVECMPEWNGRREMQRELSPNSQREKGMSFA